MNDEPYSLQPVPLMSAEKARDIGRAYKALADNLLPIEPREAAKAERQSMWWLAYAVTLANTNGGKPAA